MSVEIAQKNIEAAVAELVESGKITAENYDNQSVQSKLITAFLPSDTSKLPRPKIRAIWAEVVKSHFVTEEPEEPEQPEEAEETEEPEQPEETEETEEPEQPEEAEKPPRKPTTRGRKTASEQAPKSTARGRKQAEANKNDDFDSKVESAKTKTRGRKTTQVRNTRSTPTTQSRRKTTFCRGLNIDNPHSKYNVTDVKHPATFPESDIDLKQAEEDLIKFFTNDEELCNTYAEAREAYIEAVSELREKYAIDEEKSKKQQHFTVTKTTVKFVDPDDEKFKQAELPTSDQACFRDYESAMNDFSKAFKDAMKGDKPKRPAPGAARTPKTKEEKEAEKKAIAEAKENEKIHDLEFLLLDVIRTQNIVKIDEMVKATDIFDEYACKITNTITEPLSADDWTRLESDKNYKPFAPDYIQLFVDIKKFNGSGYNKLCKLIYSHRDALIHHKVLTRDLKLKAWLQALANIQKLKQSETEPNLVLDCWENVLSSEYAWKIVMLGLPPSDFFKHSFEVLYQEPLSIKLYESALYPISFIFTPNMLGYTDFSAPDKLFGKTDTTYKKNLQIQMEAFGSPTNNYYDYNTCNWLYYFNKTGNIKNEAVCMLHHSVELIDKESQEEQSATESQSADEN